MTDEFVAAINKARLRLAQIEAEQQRLAQEKSQLLKSIEALTPLLSEKPTQESLTLADSIRTVIASHDMNHPGTIFTPTVVRDMLAEMGFDFSPYSNHMASIHTALRRMANAGELETVEDERAGSGYRWKKISQNALRDRVLGVPSFLRAATRPSKTLGQAMAEKASLGKTQISR